MLRLTYIILRQINNSSDVKVFNLYGPLFLTSIISALDHLLWKNDLNFGLNRRIAVVANYTQKPCKI